MASSCCFCLSITHFLYAYRTWWCNQESALHVNCGSCLAGDDSANQPLRQVKNYAPHLAAVYTPALELSR